MTIRGKELREAYVSAPMFHYFRQKLAGLPETELVARLEESLKFLAISRFFVGPIPVSRDIDAVWHYWILQTQEYQRLCEILNEGKFIHHSSNDYIAYFDKDIGTHDTLSLDVKMLALYVENFGPFEADRLRYWLLAAHLSEKRGWTVRKVNEWLTQDIDQSNDALCEAVDLPQ